MIGIGSLQRHDASSRVDTASGIMRRLGVDGPQSVFVGRTFWTSATVLLTALAIYPIFGSAFTASNFTNFLLNIPLALGLALLWGFCGILSFGQVAFFGLGAYVYGVLAINFGGGSMTAVAAAGALFAAALASGLLGYFMYYGRVSGWIVPVLTFVFTLALETFLGQTAGYEWKIGDALLGGYNGMSGIPSLTVGGVEFGGFTFNLYYLVLVVVAVLFLSMRKLANSHFGHVIVAIREDPERAELLGYDIRWYQLVTFLIAGVLAGLSGVFYVSWGNYVTPSTVGLQAATMPVLWVAVGGRSSFTAVVLSTVLLSMISDSLAVYSGEFALVLLGLILLLGMMFAPNGIVVTLVNQTRRFLHNERGK